MIRFTRSILAGFTTGLVLIACTPRHEPEVVPSPVANESQEKGTCGADKLATYVGSLPSTDMIDEIKSKAGAKTVRVVGPNDAMTMDFRPERLTIEIAPDGRIKGFRCV